MQDVRNRLFELIDDTPYLDWLLLTKRPENIRRMWPKFDQRCEVRSADGNLENLYGHRRPNVWLGTSVENQDQANKRIPELLKLRDLSPVLFLSCEPLLGPVDLQGLRIGSEFDNTGLPWFDALDGTAFSSDDVGHGNPSINWIIAGGESGPNARPMHPDWARSLRDQCQASGVPFHFKQWGEWHPECSANWATGPNSYIYGKVEGISMIRDGRIVLRNERESPAGKAVVVDPFLNALPIKDLIGSGYQWLHKVGKSKAGRLLDGREWNGMPVGVTE